MKGAVLVAIAATIGNFLQGWDNATIAGTCSNFQAFLDYLEHWDSLIFPVISTGLCILITELVQFVVFSSYFLLVLI